MEDYKFSQELFTSLVETLPVLIGTFKPDGELIFVNNAYCVYFNKSREELIGSNFLELIPKPDRNTVWDNIKKITSDNPVIINEHPVFSPQGIRWQRWTNQAILDSTGEIIAYQAFGEDITEHKKVISELLESKRQQDVLLSNLSGMAYRCKNNVTRTMSYVSDGCNSLTGFNNIELVGVSGNRFDELILPEDKELLDRHRRALELGKAEKASVEYRIFDKFGELKWVWDQFQGVYSENGELMEMEGFITDIHGRKNLELQLRQAQKMEAVGVLSEGISHEFNNLLGPILGYSELLLQNKAPKDNDYYGLKQIHTAAGRAKSIIQKMSAYGRHSTSNKIKIDLANLVNEAVLLLKNSLSDDIEIVLTFEENLPLISGMLNEIHQVIMNLCINACHAMPEGGQLKIELKVEKQLIPPVSDNGALKASFTTDDSGVEKLSDQENIGYLVLLVSDTGKGMDEATMERIYDPFFTTKDVGKGTGLGLSVVKGIIEQHQGFIKVNSEVNQGSSFSVYFPISDYPRELDSTENRSSYDNKSHILLVDDEEMMLELTQTMLTTLGYEVSAFSTGAEAISFFHENASSIDLVITDYWMPELNGIALSQSIKHLRNDVPIIIMSGYGDMMEEESIAKLRIQTILKKPFRLNTLGEAVAIYCH